MTIFAICDRILLDFCKKEGLIRKMTGEGFKTFGEILKQIDGFVWGVPLIVLIILTGIYLTIRVRGLQVRHLGKALKFMVKNGEGGEGEL